MARTPKQRDACDKSIKAAQKASPWRKRSIILTKRSLKITRYLHALEENPERPPHPECDLM